VFLRKFSKPEAPYPALMRLITMVVSNGEVDDTLLEKSAAITENLLGATKPL
jgi:hypothetical protein